MPVPLVHLNTLQMSTLFWREAWKFLFLCQDVSLAFFLCLNIWYGSAKEGPGRKEGWDITSFFLSSRRPSCATLAAAAAGLPANGEKSPPILVTMRCRRRGSFPRAHRSLCTTGATCARSRATGRPAARERCFPVGEAGREHGVRATGRVATESPCAACKRRAAGLYWLRRPGRAPGGNFDTKSCNGRITSSPSSAWAAPASSGCS